MRTELISEINVHRFAAFAELAWMERRPELGAICRMAEDNGGKITASGVQKALPGLTDAGAENVRRWCIDLGLCDKIGRITSLGIDVAKSGEAPVPEQGVYDFWAVSHPLLGTRALHVQRITHSWDGRFEDIVEPELTFKPGSIFHSVIHPKERMHFRSFPTKHMQKGVCPLESKAHCKIRLVLDFSNGYSEIRMEGTIDSNRPIQHKAERIDLDLLQVEEQWARGPLRKYGKWNSHSRRLEVPCENLTEEEMEKFVRTIKLEKVDVPGCGEWTNVKLEEVPVAPSTSADATKWAMARLDRRLRNNDFHWTRADLRREFAKLTEGTPLEAHHPTLPSHDDILDCYREKPELFWQIASPVDLAYISPTSAELEALTIGEDYSRDSSAYGQPSDRSIRIPYGSRWSMQELVDKIVGERQISRVLLCDPYVKGKNNLISLQVLMDALQTKGITKLHIWTGDNIPEESLSSIHNIAGLAPRRYQDTFGRSERPHDRYIVLVPANGLPFGWQMSNSPLDTRLDDGVLPDPKAPLRWRDFIAKQLEFEQFLPQIASWCKEVNR